MSGDGNGHRNGNGAAHPGRVGELEPRTEESGFYMIAPDGMRIRITRELFVAFSTFIGSGKPSGSITAMFRNGGIAGVESLTKTVYK